MIKTTKKEWVYYLLMCLAIIEMILFAYITYRKVLVYYDWGFLPFLMSLGDIFPLYILNFALITFLYTIIIPEDFPFKILMPVIASVCTLAGGNILIIAVGNAAIWIPYKVVKPVEKDLKLFIIMLASALVISPLWFSFSDPAEWYQARPVEEPANEITQEEELALYNQFLDNAENALVENVRISSGFNDHGYAVTEVLRDQIVAILREAPVEYYYHPEGQQTPWSNIHLGVQLLDQDNNKAGVIDFYYGLDILDPESLGTEGTTTIEVFFWNKGSTYLTMDNKYMDEIFAILPKYAINYAVRNQFDIDIVNAKAKYFSALTVINDNTYPLTVTQDVLDKIGEIFDSCDWEYTYFEYDNDFPTGNIEVHITMNDCDTTLDIVYDYNGYNEKEHVQSNYLGVNGRSLIRIRARGKTEYFLVPNFKIEDIMSQFGLYEPMEKE